ncbi:unnamed protein product [Paramecium sonneborni]|uniref:non-specific serine/threonine protein kinase n=1 Tax=Paramecium sonneborni TaxID=65129 RepID=A0A8S1QVT0_9CILI|nr:unnamed protein product [Paramecium sonneborni]
MFVVTKIGQGYSADVQLVNRCGQLMAMKVFKQQQQSLYENEIKMMQLLSNIPGVIRVRECECDGCIMMDYAKQGNLLQYLKLQKFTEEFSRHYFKQIIQIISEIHKKGVAHRDLKLENILLDDNFNILICDFGYAIKFMDAQGKRIKINNYVGSPSTAAPEIFLQQPYHGIEADLFQLGVILFQITSGFCPFQTANIKSDQVYQLIYRKQHNKFWEIQQVDFSPELKDLIIKLLAFNPNQRLSISEIQTHPWILKSGVDDSLIVHEMSNRYQQILQISQNQEQ